MMDWVCAILGNTNVRRILDAPFDEPSGYVKCGEFLD